MNDFHLSLSFNRPPLVSLLLFYYFIYGGLKDKDKRNVVHTSTSLLFSDPANGCQLKTEPFAVIQRRERKEVLMRDRTVSIPELVFLLFLVDPSSGRLCGVTHTISEIY